MLKTNEPSTIDEYLDQAKKVHHIPSDNQLAARLGTTAATVCAWRMKRQWPDDDRMFHIAELAQVNPQIGLMHLNGWRTKSPPAASVYRVLAQRLIKSAAALSIGLIALTTGPDAAARTAEEQPAVPIAAYYTLCE